MDRGKHVVTRYTFRDQDGVFVVVAVPGHERDDHVLTKRQFTHVGRWTVRDNLTLLNRLAHFHQRALVDAGVLVRTLEFAHAVDVYARVAQFKVFSGADNDTAGVDLVDDTTAFRHIGSTGIPCDDFFDTCPHQWCFGLKQRHRLTLHVRAHQGPVRIVVFKERDQGRSDRDQLFRRNVDQIDILGRRQRVVTGFPCRHQIVDELHVLIKVRVRLRHGVTHFFGRGHVLHVIGNNTVRYFTVGCFDKAVFVDAGECCQRVDQTNVRTFGRFNRTHTTVVGRVNVTHLKAGTFACQTTWPKRGQTTLVRHLGQRVGLVHELRQLAGAEEFTYRSSRWLRVDQVLWHDSVDLDRGHTFLDRALHTKQADAVLVFHQLTNGAYTTVPKVVDVVDVATAVTQINQRLDTGNDVVTVQRALRVFFVERKTHVHLHAANRGKVIAVCIKEQRVEQVRRGFDCGRLARAHHTVDVHERGVAVHVLIRRHGVTHVGADVDVVDVEKWDLGDARVDQLFRCTADERAVFIVLERQLVARFDIDRAGFFVDDVTRGEFASDVTEGQQQLCHFTFVDQLLHGTRCNLLALLEQDLACCGVNQIIRWTCAPHTVREERCNPAFAVFQRIVHGVVIRVHDRFLVKAKRVEQRCYRQLTATVDAREHDVFGVEFEVEPRPAVWDDAASKQQLTRRVGFAFVVVKENAGRTVHLGYDNTLCTVHNKGTVWRHQGHVAHEHVLFFDVFHRFRTGVFIHIKYDEAQRHLQRRAVGHVALLTFLDIVFGFFELVLDVFKHRRLVEVLDRENRLEHALDAVTVCRCFRIAGAQEQIIRGFLNLDQVRHLQHFADFAIVFT